MPKYVKQEMNDLNGSGEKRCYYRIDLKGYVTSNDLVEQIAYPGSGLSKGTVMHVLQTFISEMSYSLGKGYSVTVDGLGSFRATVGVSKDKPMDTIDGDEQKRNAASIVVDGINFRVDKHFIFQTNDNCRLKKGSTSRLHKSPYSKEERLKMALSYLSNPDTPIMRVRDYVLMTKLSRSMASKELREFGNDGMSGIVSSGCGNCLVYLRSK